MTTGALAAMGLVAGRDEASRRAAEIGARPAVRRWMKRLRALMKAQPAETWLYMEECHLHLMALSTDGHRFVRETDHEGSEQASSVDSVTIPGADAGAW
jgi:hypothetical protein